MAVSPRQRHVETQAQERPDDGGGAEKCRGAEHESELADPQAREDGDRSPRRPDPERRVRAGVTRRFNGHVESHAARRRVRTELGDGQGATPGSERGPEDKPLGAADDRPLVDKFTQARTERQRRNRSRAHPAPVPDVEALDLPAAADRIGETERHQTAAARLLGGEWRRQTRQAYQHCDHGPTHVRSPHRRGFQRADRAALHRPPPSGVAGIGRLRFELDDHHRWSLWYYGEGSPVPLVRGAEIVAWVGDHPLTLAELEDSTVGNRRPPGGDAVVVRGRAAGVWVEAELLTAGGASTPQASVTVTVFPDRYLPTVRGVRFFQLPHAELLAGDGPLVALVNGAHSADPTRVVTVGAPEAEGLASHAAVGLTRGSRGLAIAFDAGEPGAARVQLSRDGLEAVSDWLPARPLRPEGDASRMRLCFHPEGDGLEALRALFVPSSPVDQERLAQAVAPTGWCTRSEWPGTVAEGDVIANLDFSAANFDRRFFRHIELDDGYQRAMGAWDANERFPHGHAWLTDQIHARGC